MIVDRLPLDHVLHHQFQRVFFSKSIKNYCDVILGVVVFLFLLFLGSSSSISFSQKMHVKFSAIFYSSSDNNAPYPKGFSVTAPEFPAVYPVVLTSFYRMSLKHLPNLFNACWLLRISLAGDFNQWEMEKYLKKKKNIWMKEKFDTRKLRENSELQVKSHDLLSSGSSDAHVF